MQFNSYVFILLFLPITVIIYFLLNKRNNTWGKIVLIASSVIFYGYGRIEMMPVLALSVCVNWIFNRIVSSISRRRKIVYILSIIFNVSLLLYFKYLNFGIRNINHVFHAQLALKELILPLGISFFTFQQISYITTVYKEETKLDLVDYLAYILYFPKLLIGPLVEPADFLHQINDNARKRFDWDNVAEGFRLFTYGLFKKAFLASAFSGPVSWGHEYHDRLSSIEILLFMLFYSFYIYFDFSGYTDMALGASKMLNIDLPINFDSPYKAVSVRDFWKRWHMSLTKFFTKYIYIPMGGSKRGEVRTYINVMIVFIISGLWHGAQWTFVLWGVLHGLLCIFDRIIDKKRIEIFEPFRWLMTMIIVGALWLLFDADSTSQWIEMLGTVVRMENTGISGDFVSTLDPPESLFIYNLLHLKGLYYNIYCFGMYVMIVVASFICFVSENNFRRKTNFSLLSMIGIGLLFAWGVLCVGGVSTFVYNGF